MAAAFIGTLAASPAYATIVVSGSFSGGGTPYNGTADPWATTSLVVGVNSPSSMTITGGSKGHNAGAGLIAFNVSAPTTVTVSGAGSSWTNSTNFSPFEVANLIVGVSGAGTLDITDGGSVSNTGNSFIGGNGDSSPGIVTVGGGAGTSTWTSSAPGQLFVGSGDEGTLTITGGGSVSNGNAFIGTNEPTEPCVVTVGNGIGLAMWTNSGSLTVGRFPNGPATLTINTGGLVTAVSLDGGNATSSVKFDGGTLRITSTDSAANTINLLASGGTIDVPTAATTLTVTSNISGAGGLTKMGQAKLELTGANGYAGGTVIDGGTLLANNTSGSATGSGGVTVNAGGTLGGTGAVSGPVIVNANATLAPGASIESLGVGGLILLSNTAKLALELSLGGSPNADLVDVTGTVNLASSTLELSLSNVPPVFSPMTFLVAANDLSDAISGTFGSITGLPSGLLASVDYAYTGTDVVGRQGDGNDLAIIISMVPEAGAFLLLGVISLIGLGWRSLTLRAKPKETRHRDDAG